MTVCEFGKGEAHQRGYCQVRRVPANWWVLDLPLSGQISLGPMGKRLR